ncbi:hypothetical protein ES702_06300 [subsurface metagenome]
MNTPAKAMPILSLLFGLNKHFRKKYCFPSQLKVLSLLKERFPVKISIATLNRWLRVMEDENYVKRQRRIRRDPVLGMVFQSTMYFITRKGYRLLNTFGVRAFAWLRSLTNGSYPTRRRGSLQDGRVRRESEFMPVGELFKFLDIPGAA